MTAPHACQVCTPGTGVTDGFELPYGFWESNPSSLEEQSVLLTTKPSFQPLKRKFKYGIL